MRPEKHVHRLKLCHEETSPHGCKARARLPGERRGINSYNAGIARLPAAQPGRKLFVAALALDGVIYDRDHGGTARYG